MRHRRGGWQCYVRVALSDALFAFGLQLLQSGGGRKLCCGIFVEDSRLKKLLFFLLTPRDQLLRSEFLRRHRNQLVRRDLAMHNAATQFWIASVFQIKIQRPQLVLVLVILAT